MSGAVACMLAAAAVTTLPRADWNPATRTLPRRSPAIAASSSSAESTLPQDLARPLREQLAGRRQPDAATGALGQAEAPPPPRGARGGG